MQIGMGKPLAQTVRDRRCTTCELPMSIDTMRYLPLSFAFALTVVLDPIGLSHAAPATVESQAVALQNSDTIEAEFRVGAAGKIGLGFKFADGKTQTLLGTVKPDALKRTVEKDGKKVPETTPMPDGAIAFSGLGFKFEYHSRPFLQRYTEAQQTELAKAWETLPAASQ